MFGGRKVVRAVDRTAGDGGAAEAAGRGRRPGGVPDRRGRQPAPRRCLACAVREIARRGSGRLLPGRGARSRGRHPRGVCAAKVQITPEAKRLLLRGSAPTGRCRGRRSTSSRSTRTARASIDESDVEAAVGDAAELALDRIVMAAASGQAAAALAECDRSVASGESPQSVIAALQRHFLRLHRMRGALDGGRSMDDVVAIAASAAAFQAARRDRAAGPQLEHCASSTPRSPASPRRPRRRASTLRWRARWRRICCSISARCVATRKS